MAGARKNETYSLPDPVLRAAMSDLTSLVYDSHVSSFLRPRQLTTHFHLDGPSATGRAACVAMFKHLKHAGVTWDAEQLCEWVRRRGWAEKDIRLLHDFCDGIQTGARFHTGPQPWSRSMMDVWLDGDTMRSGALVPSKLKIKWCCTSDAGAQPSRSERMSRSTARFTRP
jgi:hypothetical protein